MPEKPPEHSLYELKLDREIVGVADYMELAQPRAAPASALKKGAIRG